MARAKSRSVNAVPWDIRFPTAWPWVAEAVAAGAGLADTPPDFETADGLGGSTPSSGRLTDAEGADASLVGVGAAAAVVEDGLLPGVGRGRGAVARHDQRRAAPVARDASRGVTGLAEQAAGPDPRL